MSHSKDTEQRYRNAIALLKLVTQGENDYRRGDFLRHEEADAHFRKTLSRIECSGGACPRPGA